MHEGKMTKKSLLKYIWLLIPLLLFFMAEGNADNKNRQIWTAFGIFLGTCANLAVKVRFLVETPRLVESRLESY